MIESTLIFYQIMNQKEHPISEVLKEEEKVIRFEPTIYNYPLISQQLPMKRAVIIKSEKGEERKETQDIQPGLYILSIRINDNVSGKSLTKEISF